MKLFKDGKRDKPVRTNMVIWRGPNPQNPGHAPTGIGELIKYCNETFARDSWDTQAGMFYFAKEEDAAWFILRWKL